uniref:hypothetical protein n=1 Tax=uncultured Tenacibaculum sp. TaxID=174713 RepID=UPI0026351E7B|nr:hypothetical protein [uncultured Tenacibaculum sp.]
MKNKSLNILTEYFEYFLDGLKIIISDYPIIIGNILFIIGTKGYLKMIEKKPIDYKTVPATSNTINDIRKRGVLWQWVIFIIILGAYLIINFVK